MIGGHPKHILIHVRKKEEGDAFTQTNNYYDKFLHFCKTEGITPILIGAKNITLPKDIECIDLRGLNTLTLETMGYLISESKILLGNDSGFSGLKLYQQQKDKLLIMEHPRWSRSHWYFKAIGDKSNCLLLDARSNNDKIIEEAIKEYYGQPKILENKS